MRTMGHEFIRRTQRWLQIGNRFCLVAATGDKWLFCQGTSSNSLSNLHLLSWQHVCYRDLQGIHFEKQKKKNHTKCPLGSWLRNTTKETITQCRTRLSFCYLPLRARQWGHVSHPQIQKPQTKDSTNDPKVNKDLAGVTLFYSKKNYKKKNICMWLTV